LNDAMGHSADKPRERCRLPIASAREHSRRKGAEASHLCQPRRRGEASHIEAIDLRRMFKTTANTVGDPGNAKVRRRAAASPIAID
jgi:hypothetical protein